MRDRLAGLLLFLPVPLVLGLFTRAPLGVAQSIGVGVLLAATHRLYSRPFARNRAERRCLWCGGEAGDGPEIRVFEAGAETSWRACSASHAASIGRLLGWADAHRLYLRIGILGTLALFLPAALAAGAGRLGAATFEDVVNAFRFGIAVTVLPLGWLSGRNEASPASPLRSPFPLHIQALLGSWSVLWLFRLVGLAWLGLALVHAARRLGIV